MLKVSIIIPNYNHGAFLKQRIDSILNQTYSNYELIILDDCSNDNSREVIEGYRAHPKVKYISYNEVNSGSPFLQWKKGLSFADGELIWIAESDDYSDVNFLKVAVESLGTENADFFWCNSFAVYSPDSIVPLRYVDVKGFNYNKTQNIDAEEFIRKYLLWGNTIQNVSSVVARRSLFSGLDFDLNFRLCGDWLIYLYILKQARRVCYCSERLNYYRKHPHNTSSSVSDEDKLEEARRVRAMLSAATSFAELKKVNRRAAHYDEGVYLMALVRQRRYLKASLGMFKVLYYLFPDFTFIRSFVYWTIKNRKNEISILVQSLLTSSFLSVLQ